jgi:tetratricopeptide (TPR) repeat protein
MVLVTAGHVEEATQNLEFALRQDPENATVRYWLGVAALRAGDLDRAAAELRSAIQLWPEYTDATVRLGGVLAEQGHMDESLALLRQAVAAAPANADAHCSLAWALLRAHGQDTEVIEHLEAAIRCDPSWVEAIRLLGWLKATRPDPVRDPAGALALAQRAVAITRQSDPDMLELLAVAQAATGQFDRAIETASQALELASRSGDASRAEEIRSRLAGFRRQIR